MGLFSKLKNALFEEEYVEVEEKPKKEVKKEKIVEKPERRRRNHESSTIDDIKPSDISEETMEQNTISSKPIEEERFAEVKSTFQEFNDDDFESETRKLKKIEEEQVEEPPVEVIDEEPTPKTYPTRVKKETTYKEELEKEEISYKSSEPYSNSNYKSEPYGNVDYKPIYSVGEKKDPQFKPTPIISPIFGILDKNYKKEDVMDKKEVKKSSSYVSNKVDIDSVRQKAFGELNDDLNLTGEDSFKKIEEEQAIASADEELEDNLLYDMSDTTTAPVVNKVTVADAEEYFDDLGLEYNVDYKDSKYEKSVGRHVKTTEVKEIEPTAEIPQIVEEEVVEEPKVEKQKAKTNNLKESALEDNLFDLIDSMYEDKE